MTSEALFEVAEPEVAEPREAAAPKWTERLMLDLIRRRYEKDSGNGPRYVVAEHVRSEAGFGTWDPKRRRTNLRTADALAIDLWPSSGNLIHGFEVKVSRSDWLAELKDPSKAEAFKRHVHHWWLVVPDVSIVRDDLPDDWGLLAGVGDGFRIKHRAPKLAPEPMPLGLIASWLRAAVKTAAQPTQTTDRHEHSAHEGGDDESEDDRG